MRRTQLYLDDDLWAALHATALIEGATVSELVRVAVRERYLGNLEERRAAMFGIVGLWKDRPGKGDAESPEEVETWVRTLRDDDRLDRLERFKAE